MSNDKKDQNKEKKGPDADERQIDEAGQESSRRETEEKEEQRDSEPEEPQDRPKSPSKKPEEEEIESAEKEHQAHGGQQAGHKEHGDHHEQMLEDFKKRFWISLGVTIPILLLSDMVQQWFGFEITFTGSRYVLGVLGTFIYFYGGGP